MLDLLRGRVFVSSFGWLGVSPLIFSQKSDHVIDTESKGER